MRQNLGRYVAGLGLIGLGVGFILNNLGWMDFGDFLRRFWPAILIGIGLLDLSRGRLVSALLWAALGTVLLLNSLGIVRVNIWAFFWPVILILIGMRLLWRGPGDRRSSSLDGQTVYTLAAFGGETKRVDGTQFARGSLNALFGEGRIDLRQAGLDPAGAVIDVFVLFGGGTVLVPPGTEVVMQTMALFGGTEDKRTAAASKADAPRLTVRGTVLFGGLEIKE